jgi:hypothetical protein
MSVDRIPGLIRTIYGAVADLERLFPQRKFTPDGILVGSIGEVLAAYYYGLSLLPQSNANHDACAPDGTQVQVKTTQRDSIDIRTEPDHLLVLKLYPDGRCEEIFNGPGSLVWGFISGKPMPKEGFYQVPLSKLARMAAQVPVSMRLPPAFASEGLTLGPVEDRVLPD